MMENTISEEKLNKYFSVTESALNKAKNIQPDKTHSATRIKTNKRKKKKKTAAFSC